ncbi:MAG: RHS repeat-associated core domain-containing protein, partial [Candidatus Saccharibacteria bacterium]|nr:RHS repeat-associated core domain-containing protein [Candidatus Saccharibacteria bacterium]
NLISQTSPDTGTTTFTYDAAGNRLSQTDARSVMTQYTYDALNRIKTIKYPAAAAENLTFTYDVASSSNKGVGRLNKIAKTGFSMSYTYDHLGLVTQKASVVGTVNKNVKYIYHEGGNINYILYPSARFVYYHYDTAGRVNKITTKLGSSGATQTLVDNVGYLPFGPANTYRYGNTLTHNQTYDQDYRLTNIQVGGLLNRTYGYDPVNNITSIVNSLNNSNSQSFSYDALNRLITANGGYGNLGYGYDAVGNRLSETRNGSSDIYQYETTSNRLTGITRASGNRNFTYDAAGNPIQRTADDNSAQTYSFNKANRLGSVSVNGTQTATYTYNPLGQRVLKTLANGSKEIYHYDESGQLIAVLDGAGVTLREYIYWGNQQIALVNNGTIYYIHNDHLNTPQVMTNQSQQVVWMGDYEPFGKVAANATNSVEIFSRFPGQYVDNETGLYYNYFRDYDPSIGRYIESDPIGLEGGINTYAYVGGNPLSYIDPHGLDASALSSWNSFQSALNGHGLNSSQMSSLYRQNQLNSWANTGNHNWTPGFPNSAMASGIGGVVDVANQAINRACFARALRIQDEINRQIQEAANQSPSCGDTFWQVVISMGQPTGCIQSYSVTTGNSQSIWTQNAFPVGGSTWTVRQGRL